MSSVVKSSAFTLPPPRRRIGSAEPTPGGLLLMLAIGFLLASPVVTLLIVAGP